MSDYFARQDAILNGHGIAGSARELSKSVENAPEAEQQLAYTILSMISEQQRLEREITQQGKWITSRVENVDAGLETGGVLNSLGELQQLGAQYDVTIARLTTTRSALSSVAAVWVAGHRV